MSIAKAQAKALADGFLDTVGADKDAFMPEELYTEVIVLAGDLIQRAQDNLIATNLIATGNLSESIVARDPELNGTVFSVDVTMLYYGQFVNKGVRGTRSGTGLYQFRTDFPSKKMVAAIDAWIKRAQISIDTVKENKNYGRNEGKNRRIAKIDTAYAFARSIKMKGIRPRYFMDRATTDTAMVLKERFGAAAKLDIIKSIIR